MAGVPRSLLWVTDGCITDSEVTKGWKISIFVFASDSVHSCVPWGKKDQLSLPATPENGAAKVQTNIRTLPTTRGLCGTLCNKHLFSSKDHVKWFVRLSGVFGHPWLVKNWRKVVTCASPFSRYLIRSCSFDFAFFRLSRRIINGKVDRSAPDVWYSNLSRLLNFRRRCSQNHKETF